MNLIDVALFGPDGRSWAPYLTQGAEGTELEVELTFEHGEALWRVRRGYSARGAGKTTLDLERMNGAGWEPVTLEGQRATQAQVEEILGLTRETFRASAFLAQGDGAAFTEAKPADRKRILAAVLGLDRFEKPLALVKGDRKAAQQRIERLTGALERADVELAERPAVAEALRVAADEAAACAAERVGAAERLEQAAAAAAAIEQQRAARAEAEGAVALADAELRPLEQQLAEVDAARQELVAVDEELARLATPEQRTAVAADVQGLEGRMSDYRQAVTVREQLARDAAAKTAQRDAIAAQAAAKRQEAARLDEQLGRIEADELQHCPTCTQHLGADARRETMSNLRARAEVLDDEAKALDEAVAAVEIPAVPAEPEPPVEVEQQLSDARRRLAQVDADLLRRELLAGKTQILRERAAAAPPEAQVAAARAARAAATASLEALPPAPAADALATAQAAALQARAAIDAAVAWFDQAKAAEARAAAKAERLDELAASTKADRAQRETEQKLVDRLLLLERAFGRDGIPALIVQAAAIPAIETEAGRILDELGTSYRVELRTAKALAGGGMADALDVVVVTEKGERPYETFSGGERTRLNLALRIALARLLATRRGAESRILAIDEPEFLDEAGTAALARVLQGLNGDFERVYLISHVPDLRGAFDQTVEVVKGDDGLSRIAA